MKPNEMLALLAFKEVTQRSIARKLGYSYQAVSRLIYYDIGSDKLRTALAEAVGQDKRWLWPEYYLTKARKKTRKRQNFQENTPA